MLFNLGVHYFQHQGDAQEQQLLEHCKRNLANIAQAIKEWSMQDGRTAIFRGTTPQHFQTPDGRYSTQPAPGFKCQPVTSPSTQREVDRCFFDYAQGNGVNYGHSWSHSMIYYTSIYSPMIQRYDAHPSSFELGDDSASSDCTHWCMFPALWELQMERVYLALLHDRIFGRLPGISAPSSEISVA